jgi:hypothetical protein
LQKYQACQITGIGAGMVRYSNKASSLNCTLLKLHNKFYESTGLRSTEFMRPTPGPSPMQLSKSGKNQLKSTFF